MVYRYQEACALRSNFLTDQRTESTMASQVLCRKITPDFKARISKAQGIKLNWADTCTPTLLKTVSAHAEAVGSPKEYIFFPLLTVSASFMGINAALTMNGVSQQSYGML